MNPYLELQIVLFLGVVLLFVVTAVPRYTTCWNRLEKHYFLRSYRPAEDFGLQRIKITSPIDPTGLFNHFGWTIRVGAGPDGVHLAGIQPIHLVLRPLTIPWDDVILSGQPFVRTTEHELIAAKVAEVQFSISRTLLENLESARSSLKRGELAVPVFGDGIGDPGQLNFEEDAKPRTK